MHIGIFDSGRGGRFVTNILKHMLPEHKYTVTDDRAHAPYGQRSYDDIQRLTHRAIQPLVATCDVIVIACNTATAAAIDSLRQQYPTIQFVGFEPMIRPAATYTTNNHITLLATTATVNSSRTKTLIQSYGSQLTIETPDTTAWASSIDAGQVDTIDLSDVKLSIDRGSDTIIIGCTHYIGLLPRLEEIAAGRARILEPTLAVANRLRQLV